MSYPEVITFKDSVVASTVLGVMSALISIGLIRMYFETGDDALVAFIFVFIAAILIISALNPTISTLSLEGVEVKAWGGTVFHKWTDLNDLQIYKQHGYMGVGRRFVTFQDETKRLQKHVFLVPINISSKPAEVLETVKSYRAAALEQND